MIFSRIAFQRCPHVTHIHVAPAASNAGVTVWSNVWHSGQIGMSSGAVSSAGLIRAPRTVAAVQAQPGRSGTKLQS